MLIPLVICSLTLQQKKIIRNVLRGAQCPVSADLDSWRVLPSLEVMRLQLYIGGGSGEIDQVGVC